MELSDLQKLAHRFRVELITMTHQAQSGHVTSCLSCVEILTALYFGSFGERRIFFQDPQKPHWQERDYFVLSKGHAAPILYVILAALGYFPASELNNFRKLRGMLQGHPMRKIPGIDTTIGAYGQGLSIANGIALSLKIDQAEAKLKLERKVYVLCGDGELQCGQMWEAIQTAAQHKLDNLCLIIDNNMMQQTNFTRAIKDQEPLGPRFLAFGWNVITVRDGHDFEQLLPAYERFWKSRQRPSVMICDTIKGKGVPFAEGKTYYHGKAFSDEEVKEAFKALSKVGILGPVHINRLAWLTGSSPDSRREERSVPVRYISDEQRRSRRAASQPEGKQQILSISASLLLDVLFQYAFVVVP